MRDPDAPRRPTTRITAMIPADGWRLVWVETTPDEYVGVRCEPIPAWVAVEVLGDGTADKFDRGFAYVTHMTAIPPGDGSWSPEEERWNEIGYLGPGEAWEPADWDAVGRDAWTAHQAERARIAARVASRHA